MDPNATLKMIDDFLRDRHTGPEVDRWCKNLYDWIELGGFEPRWEQCRLGTSYYKCQVIRIERSA